MDEALRRLSRGDDPLALAVALRRAGDELAARRLVEERVRAGDAAARALLDELWPPSTEDEELARRVRERDLLRPAGYLTELLGEEDPRLDPVREALVRLEEGVERLDQEPEVLAGFVALHRGPLAARRREALASGSTLPLARIRLDADEAATLLSNAEGAPTEGGRESRGVGAPLRLLCALWHVGRARAVARAAAVERHLRHPDPLVASEAWRTLEALGVGTTRRPPAPRLLPALPFRPAWAPAGCPGLLLRDGLTGAHARGPLLRRLTPGADGWAPDGALLYLDLDGLRRVRDALGHEPVDQLLHGLTRAFQEAVGDRVVRHGGDEWLVPLEPGVEAAPLADALRREVAGHDRALRLTATVGIGRGATVEAALRVADRALERGKAAGGDTVSA